MSNFSLTNDTDRADLIAALKARGIEAFRNGLGSEVSALAGGGVDVMAYTDKTGRIRVAATGPNAARICSGGRATLAEAVDTFAGLFGLCETGDAGRYAAKADSSKTEATT